MYTHITRGSHQLRQHRTVGTALITTCCVDRQPLLEDPVAAAIVLDSLHWQDAQQRLLLHAAVVMPDHVHFVADPLGCDWRTLLRSIKSFTANEIRKRLHHEGRVWQAQYHDHRITTDAQLLMAVDYCLQNPVRAGLVSTAAGWRHSWSRFSPD
jgi:REP element-mobilizing transposase RayT